VLAQQFAQYLARQCCLLVGATVGFLEGDLVARVGFAAGLLVGATVGFLEGDLVARVGFAAGLLVGATVGFLVGDLVARLVGSMREGNPDGGTEGYVLGTLVTFDTQLSHAFGHPFLTSCPLLFL